MKKIAYSLIIIALSMIFLGIVTWEYIDTQCKTIDKNTDFWVRNCDYK